MNLNNTFRLYVPHWFNAIQFEIILLWRFNRYDLSSTLIPAILFLLAAWHSEQPDWHDLPYKLAWGILYFWLYCSSFCISNQLAGESEDKVNKPDRPLPSGMVSRNGAWIRWLVVMVLFTTVGWYLKVLEWTLLWQISLILHNFGHWSNHYVTKNIVMTLGTIAQLAAAWQIVRPITPIAWQWILLPALTFLTHISVQDLRDIAGDRVLGRRTFPIVFGEMPSRRFLAIAFVLLPLIIPGGLFLPFGLTSGTIIFGCILTGLCWIIAWRLIFLCNPKADHISYMLFTYWYCFFLASAIVLL